MTWSVSNSEAGKTETITDSDSALIPVGTQFAPSQTKTFTKTVSSATAETITLTGTWVDPTAPDDATKNVVVVDSGSIAVGDFPSCTPPTESVASTTESVPSDEPSSATPVCIPNSAVGYTYDLDTNSGDITVSDVPNSTGVLCHPFWVTATSWLYTHEALWPQVLDQVVKLPEISTPGVYHFAAAVTCGQGDIYASFDSQPEPFGPMVSPGKPFHENFLHDMGFTPTSANPYTYTAQPFSCNTVTPVAPTATSIATCNQYGSVSVPADTTKVHYTVVGSGNVGDYVVTAEVQSPYNLAEGATTSWTFHLGSYVTCPPEKAIPGDPSASPEVCTDGTRSNGSITVDLQKGLIYSIAGVGNSVSIPVVTTAVTSLPAGDYKVSVAAAPGYVLTGATAWPFTLTVDAVEDCGDFPTLSVQPVNVTSTTAGCTADGSAAGTITVGQVQGVDFTQYVQYSIDGKPVSTVTTSVAAGSHVVTAVALGDNSLEPGSYTQPDGSAKWTIAIASAGVVCADLKTLALTGTNSMGWLLFGVLLLNAGIVLLTVRVVFGRRRTQRAS